MLLAGIAALAMRERRNKVVFPSSRSHVPIGTSNSFQGKGLPWLGYSLDCRRLRPEPNH